MNPSVFSFLNPRQPGLVLLLGLALLAAPAAWAQPGSGGPGPTIDPTQTPLDGGASLLLVSGIGYAIRRLRRKRPS